jgi:hypothetical protein
MNKEKQIEEMAGALKFCKDTSIDECNTKKDCRHCIAEQIYTAGYRKQGEWISVKDILPDRKQAVLAYRGEFRGDMMDIYTHLNNDLWEDAYGYRVSTEHEGITHWMYLPEPPKE